jgi:hypothetical protein
MSSELTEAQVREYVKAFPKRADVKLGFLLKNKAIVKAYETPIGQDILRFLIEEHEELFEKITALTASDQDKIRFTILRDVIWRIANRIEKYERQVDDVRKLKE